jgi:hypothetical protein
MFLITHSKSLEFKRPTRLNEIMAAQGRFGKYGDHKRKSGLRKNRVFQNRLQNACIRQTPVKAPPVRKQLLDDLEVLGDTGSQRNRDQSSGRPIHRGRPSHERRDGP